MYRDGSMVGGVSFVHLVIGLSSDFLSGRELAQEALMMNVCGTGLERKQSAEGFLVF